MFSRNVARAAGRALSLAGALLLASTATGKSGFPLARLQSPPASDVAPVDAWRLAENLAAAAPNREVVVGRGNSMLPLYHDRTVLVLERMEMSALRAGMTVVFIGDRGRPVAHVLVERTPRGWIAAGLGNRERDRTRVRITNYIGTVIRAFAPKPAVAALSVPASSGYELAMGRLLAAAEPAGQ